MRYAIVLLVLLMLLPAGAVGQSASTAPSTSSTDPNTKLTIALYHTRLGDAEDINLRHQFATFTAWGGAYRTDHTHVEARIGAQYNFQRGLILIQPAAQTGTSGFFQGSLYSELGSKVFAILGESRTNLKEQNDLTFDPNNSWQLGAGWNPDSNNRVVVFTIADNRLHTNQQNTHLIWKHRIDSRSAITFDSIYKSGRTDSGRDIHAGSFGIYYDRGWFAKLYYDPYASFGDERQLRLSFGRKF